MTLGFLVFIAICVSSVLSDEVTLPASVKTCKKATNDYSSCLRLAIQESWPVFVKGIPVLDLPPLDPFFTEYMENNFEFGDVTGKMVVRNANSYGMANTKFLSVKPMHQDNHFTLEIDLEIPHLFVEGDFKSNGRLGAFNMGAKGQFNITMESVRSIISMSGPIVNDRWVIKDFSYSPEIGSMKIWASDLFNGNAELTKVMLAFANEHWEILYQGMLPYASKTWNADLKKLVNGIFSKISFSKTFP